MDKEESKIYEVCYVVNIDGKNDKDVNVNWKIFVNSENGDISNILKDGAEKEAITK